MTSPDPSHRPFDWAGWRAPLALVATVLLALILTWQMRPGLDRFWGDEPTFTAMAESVAHDGDLRFDERDLARLKPVGEVRGTVILHRTDDGFFFSKPVLYALVAGPFTLLLGTLGPVVLNVSAWLVAVVLLHAYFCRLGPPADARWLSVTAACGGVALPQLVWRMSDAVQMALGVAAMVLVFAREQPAPNTNSRLQRWLSSRWAPFLGAALLGLLTSMRLPNGVLAAAPVGAALLRRRWRETLGLALAAALGFAVITQLGAVLVDTPNPYKAHRSSFSPDAGYPVGEEAARGLEHLQRRVSTNLLPAVPTPDRRSAYAFLYFWVGRHCGLLLYLPLAGLVLIEALPQLDRIRLVALAAFFGLAIFYLLWQPDNFFGGGTFLGNRYILPAYGALLVALPRLPSRRRLGAVWLWSSAVLLSAVTSLRLASQLDNTSQSHAHASLFRLAPYESVASNIDGRQDRYWSGDFVRFVDPFAEASDWSFRLDSARPAAELQLATARAEGHRLQVDTPVEGARLEIREGLRRRVYEVSKEPGGRPPVIDLDLGWPWRRHQFWWDDEAIYGVHSLRFQLSLPGDARGFATVRYLGAGRELADDAFSCQVMRLSQPTRVAAGSSSSVRLRLRNTGPIAWPVDGVLPIRLAYRLTELATGAATEGAHQRLPVDVAPGRSIRTSLRVEWPESPGTYTLAVDLVREHVAWFGDHTGRPLATRRVEVVTAGSQP